MYPERSDGAIVAPQLQLQDAVVHIVLLKFGIHENRTR
jgi:hypothetical protein